MNDEEPLSEAEEARIRALLADARHDEPTPDAVVARLDRVLAGLADEPVERPLPANVVPLAVRRRRAARMLVAAAAVVVAGVGVHSLVENGTLNSADAGGNNALAGDAPARAQSPENLSKGPEAASGGGAATGPELQDGLRDADAFRLRPQHFARDSERVQQKYADLDSSYSAGLPAAAPVTCRSGSWGAGQYVPVRYGRAPAVLVLRRPTGDSQVADLFLCGSDEPVRSITLPGP